ncbi:hypothetical protein C5E51_02950 [Nocardia nova]|nr:hypothetical protein C5E51_02950 [Nocardia nova]
MDSQSQIDDRAIGTGTAIRFALLIVVLVAATAAMTFNFANGVLRSGSWVCWLAAGGDPDQDIGANIVLIGDQWHKLRDCSARYEPSAPWWTPMSWTAVVIIAATGLFVVLPAWKSRKNKVARLEAIDPDGHLEHQLHGLVDRAGLPLMPRFVVDPTAGSAGAVVFGRTTRPTVCLHGGLIAQRDSNSHRFRAVVLHELAHIHNMDVTITYLTIALWRVFLALVLTPYVVSAIFWLTVGHHAWNVDIAGSVRDLVVSAFLTLLVYLARADLLRHREICADRTAVRWGADARGWVFHTPEPVTGAVRKLFREFVELWRTHPSWDLRREGLADPAQLFGVRGLPFFLTGAAGMVIIGDARSFLPNFVDTPSTRLSIELQCIGFVAAVLITAVAGTALCRSVIFADLTDRRVPSGAVPGLWLGCGFAVGDLLTGGTTILLWPLQRWVVVVPVLAGVATGVWIAEGSLLWARIWRGRSSRPIHLLVLVPAGLLMAAWLTEWDNLRSELAQALTFEWWQSQGPAMPNHLVEQKAADLTIRYLGAANSIVVVPIAVAAVWVVPLTVWMIRRRDTAPGWTESTLGGAIRPAAVKAATPPLRWMMRPVVVGTVACWAAAVAVQAYMHTWRPAPVSMDYAWIDWWWLLVALAVGAVSAAIAASTYSTPYQLIIAVAATETALLFGGVGIFLLTTADGCIPPLTTFASVCATHPREFAPLFDGLPAILLAGFVIAAAATAGAAVIRAVHTRVRNQPVKAAPGTLEPAVTGGRRRLAAMFVAAIGVAAIGVVAFDSAVNIAAQSHQPSDQQVARFVTPLTAPSRPVSAVTRARQLDAWIMRGGEALVTRLHGYESDFESAITFPDSDTMTVETKLLRPACGELVQIADDADRYFRVPDPPAQTLWQAFLTQARTAGNDCLQALDAIDAQYGPDLGERQGDPNDPLAQSLRELDHASDTAMAALTKMTQDVQAGVRAQHCDYKSWHLATPPSTGCP